MSHWNKASDIEDADNDISIEEIEMEIQLTFTIQKKSDNNLMLDKNGTEYSFLESQNHFAPIFGCFFIKSHIILVPSM